MECSEITRAFFSFFFCTVTQICTHSYARLINEARCAWEEFISGDNGLLCYQIADCSG